MKSVSLIAAALSVALMTSSCSEAPMPVPAPAPAPAPDAVPMDTSSPPPAEVIREMGGICNIEAIGGVSGDALDAPVVVDGASSVSGWRTLQADNGSEAAAWLRVLNADGAVAMQVGLPATEDRPDLVEATKRDSALRSGFRNVGISGLAPGTYSLQVVLDSGSDWVRCKHTRTLTIN